MKRVCKRGGNFEPELSFLGPYQFSLSPCPQFSPGKKQAHSARSGSNVSFLDPFLLVPTLGRINSSHPSVALWLSSHNSIIVACFTLSQGTTWVSLTSGGPSEMNELIMLFPGLSNFVKGNRHGFYFKRS